MCVRVAVQFFLSEPLRHRNSYTKALLSIPSGNYEKWFRRALNPPHAYTKAFWSGARLHDCSGLSCNSGRRILGLFPSRRRKQKGLTEAGFSFCALSPTLAPVIAEQKSSPNVRSKRLSRRQGRTRAFGRKTKDDTHSNIGTVPVREGVSILALSLIRKIL